MSAKDSKPVEAAYEPEYGEETGGESEDYYYIYGNEEEDRLNNFVDPDDDFDEKEEILVENISPELEKRAARAEPQDIDGFESEAYADDFVAVVACSAANDLDQRVANRLTTRNSALQSVQSKSSFSSSSTNYVSNAPLDATNNELEFFSDEKYIFDLENVNCVFSLSSQLMPENVKEIKNANARVKGRLILTSYRLLFVACDPEKMNKADSLFDVDKRLLLFNCQKLDFSVVINLASIYEIRASTNLYEKNRKLKSILDNKDSSPIRDITITSKNFMKKRFILENPINSTADNIHRFASSLLFYSNYQAIIHNRFQCLIQMLNLNKDNPRNALQGQATSSVSSTSSNETAISLPQAYSNGMRRKSYQMPNDLQDDLIECRCDSFMQVKSGRAEVILQNKFKIDTNMPFCALPKNIAEIIKRRRVVLNEQNVSEFIDFNQQNENKRNTIFGGGSLSSKHSTASRKLTKFLGTSHHKQYSNHDAIDFQSPLQYQQPLLANLSTSNPFHENRFPIWSYTDANSGCSLIIVPESASNRQDECDIIVKNYNSLLWDEIFKLKGLKQPRVKVASQIYAEYEFFKLHVPFGYEKISSSYSKLMNLCSFTAYCDFYKENETFMSRLNDTKWLRHVSKMLELTSKIVLCIGFHKRHVFIEERRYNMDCTCILTSLVKICLNSKYRTIVGLENLIQKDWFLAGHMFRERLYATPASKSSLSQVENDFLTAAADGSKRKSSTDSGNILSGSTENLLSSSSSSSSKGKEEFAPTFLLFLDCLFQLVMQCPNEFEFTELFLIHLWDYSISGLSFTYGFNGILSWFTYLNNQTFLTPSNLPIDSFSSINLSNKASPVSTDNKYLQRIFEMNIQFWQNHLSTHGSILINKNYTGSASVSSIVIHPCDKMYMIKFWTRCYLRWIEKYHSYNNSNESVQQAAATMQQQQNDDSSFKPRRPPPPPLPPKPNNKPSKESGELLDRPEIVIGNFSGGEFKVVTRVTDDGNIESSF